MSSVVLPALDIEPAAASYTGSGIPDASSHTSSTLALCMPCIASGVSGRDVRAVMKLSASDFSVRWSLVTVQSFCHGSGSRLYQPMSSGHNASNSCGLVGAVHTHLNGARVLANHTMIH